MKITFLGTASASVTSHRDNVSILVDSDPDLILMDCSGNPAGKLLKLGYDPNDLDVILLSHLHIDHCYGLPTLLFHMFLNDRNKSLQIMVPKDEAQDLDQQMEVYHLKKYLTKFEIEIIPVSGDDIDEIWRSDANRISAVKGEHSRMNLAYRIDRQTERKSVTFSGDTRPNQKIRELAANTDLLVHESTYLESHQQLASDYGHSTAIEAAEVARDASVKKLALIHMELSDGISENLFRQQAQSVYKHEIYLPADFDCITL